MSCCLSTTLVQQNNAEETALRAVRRTDAAGTAKKTVSAGIGEEALEAAMEASDVKGALVALLVSASRHSSYERTVR